MNNKKIYQDEIDWLVYVACSVNIEDVKKEAYDKLIEYGLNDDIIQQKFKNLDNQKKIDFAFDKAWENQLKRNATEIYNLREKIIIFFFGFYSLKEFDTQLVYLYKNNYKIKFRQRFILLVSGILFWILLIISIFSYHENERLKEIDKLYNEKYNKK